MNVFQEIRRQREIQEEMDEQVLFEQQIYKGFGIDIPFKRRRHVSYYFTRSFKLKLWLFKIFHRKRMEEIEKKYDFNFKHKR